MFPYSVKILWLETPYWKSKFMKPDSFMPRYLWTPPVLSKKMRWKKRYYPVNRLQKQTVQTDGPIPELAVWLSLMRNPYPAKVVFVWLFQPIQEKEQSVLLPTRTMQLMEIAVSPIMSMGKIGRNITESFFPSIRIVTAHV